MSKQSGGFAIVNTDDFASGLNRILVDLDNYYLLGFYPADLKSKGYRPVTVTVLRPGLTVRARGGYDLTSAADHPKDLDPLAALASNVVSTPDLPLRLAAVSAPGRAGSDQVAVAIEIRVPRQPLAAADGRVRDTVRYSLVAVDLDRKKIANQIVREAHIVLKPTASGSGPPPEAQYAILTAMSLNPGRYQLRLAATSARLGRGGSVYQTIDVPDFAKTPLALGGVALAPAVGTRVPVADTAVAKGLLPFDPTLDREFASSATLEVVAPIGGSSRGQLAARLQLYDRSERIVADVSARVEAASLAVRTDRGTGTLQQRFAIGEIALSGLPGPYGLSLRVTDGRTAASQSVGIVVK